MLDPLSPEGRDLLEYIKLFLSHMVPARLGVLLLPSNDVGVVLTQGFSQVATDKTPRDALRWLMKVRPDYAWMAKELCLVNIFVCALQYC